MQTDDSAVAILILGSFLLTTLGSHFPGSCLYVGGTSPLETEILNQTRKHENLGTLGARPKPILTSKRGISTVHKGGDPRFLTLES